MTAHRNIASDTWTVAGRTFTSRLIVGTGKYKSFEQNAAAVAASGAEIVTVAVRRVNISDPNAPLLIHPLRMVTSRVLIEGSRLNLNSEYDQTTVDIRLFPNEDFLLRLVSAPNLKTVSHWFSETPKHWMQKYKRMEAKVGIEQMQGVFPKLTTPQLSPHHRRRTTS